MLFSSLTPQTFSNILTKYKIYTKNKVINNFMKSIKLEVVLKGIIKKMIPRYKLKLYNEL